MWILVYKQQIYQIAESNRIEKNRFNSDNWIETVFALIGMLYSWGGTYTKVTHWRPAARVLSAGAEEMKCAPHFWGAHSLKV